ncbi:hypothetical protein [Halorubrum aethiopicum]|uniref:hypothetical protein n=1 Tax=Halorubrum aethiopicum TaxID=1758255 RepID=UPI000AC1A1C8|nr:hypothetical protein [Halorubrum aethiopicum]
MSTFGNLENSIGSNRAWALARLGMAVLYIILGWIPATIAFVIGAVYFLGDITLKLTVNRRMEFLKPWARSTLVWNYDLILWIFGVEDWPGWMGWTP